MLVFVPLHLYNFKPLFVRVDSPPNHHPRVPPPTPATHRSHKNSLRKVPPSWDTAELSRRAQPLWNPRQNLSGTVDGSEIRRLPVEVGSLSNNLHGFYRYQVVVLGFLPSKWFLIIYVVAVVVGCWFFVVSCCRCMSNKSVSFC